MTRQLLAITVLILTDLAFVVPANAQEHQVTRRLFENMFVTGGTSFVVEGPINSPKIYQSVNGTDYHLLTIVKCECGNEEFMAWVTDPQNESRGQFQVHLSRRGLSRPYIINIPGDPAIYTDIGRMDFSKYKFHPPKSK